jgi:hypothetical protein
MFGHLCHRQGYDSDLTALSSVGLRYFNYNNFVQLEVIVLYLREVGRSFVQFWAHYMRRMKLNRCCPVQIVKRLASSKLVA